MNLPGAIESGGGENSGASLVRLDFDRQPTEEEPLAFEDQVLLAALEQCSPEISELAAETAKNLNATPRKIVESAISSYVELCRILMDEGPLFYKGRDNQLHPISSGEAGPQPAA